MRILGLDYGSKTVGVAITDGLMLTAQCYETVKREHEDKLRRTLARISEIVKQEGVERIALGLPLNMDGTQGERAMKVLAFKELLEKRTGLTVDLVDERLTTVAADEILDETGFSKDRAKRKEVIDQIAAQLILEDYMKTLSNGDK